MYLQVENPYDIQNIPLNPAFEVSIPPIESPNAGNGSGTFDDLTKERLFVQTQGVFNKQVSWCTSLHLSYLYWVTH